MFTFFNDCKNFFIGTTAGPPNGRLENETRGINDIEEGNYGSRRNDLGPGPGPGRQ
jgi:hypothetical protein